jgi:hypothetical protein
MSTRAAAKRVPEFFITSARKVEPIGGDCIRIYCSMERNGGWEDQMTIIMPIAAAVASSDFVMQSATDIYNEGQMTLKFGTAH